MRRRRWSDNDHNFGPFTFAWDRYKRLGVLLGSGDGDEYPGCFLRIHLIKWTFIVNLPSILKPYREKHDAAWNEATIARLGRDWYWSYDAREYGFSFSSDGPQGFDFLQVYYGRQPHSGDSRTEQRWGWFLPWKQWRHVRTSLYGLTGQHFADENATIVVAALGAVDRKRSWEEWSKLRDECPKQRFIFSDYDDELITATTRIEEREWHRGTGWFKWLSFFFRPKISRSLDLSFDKEVGREKGSWKGGTLGHSIKMLPGELHEAAFRRYCEGTDTRSKKPRGMTFLGIGSLL